MWRMRTYLVYLLVLSIFCVYRCTCSCSTRKSSYGPVRTYCTWSTLSAVPHNIDEETTELHLGFNVITHISGYDWSKLPVLEELDLNNNNFVTLRGTSWSGLSSLKKLSLRDNKITSLIGANWSGLENLLELKLDDNGISSLVGLDWEGLTSLKELNLIKNKLTTVKDVDWSQLTALRILNLGYNSIDLSDATWYGLKSLKELKLYENGIYSLDEAKWYGLDSVYRLSLTYNHIYSLANANWCGLWSLKKLFLLQMSVGDNCKPSLCIPKTLYDDIIIYIDPEDCVIQKCKVMKPVFHVRAPGFVVLKEGESESLNMSTISIPEDVVYSLKNGYSSNIFMDNEILQISNVRSIDRGSIIVKAENSEGSTMHTFNLYVQFKPVFDSKTSKEIQINEGNSKSMNFSAEAYPLPITYTLYKDGRQFKQPQIVMDNGVLNIYSITRQYSGSYILKAENSEGSTNFSVNVVVRVKPQFNVNAATQIVIKEGRSDIFNMSASGIPKNITYVLRQRPTTHVVMNKGMLEITNITGKENGSYALVAKNTAGATLHWFTITVKLKPVFRENLAQQFSVIEGQSQLFNMSALGEGIMYTLYKDGVKTTTSHIEIKKAGMVEIKNINKADGGVYMLQAKNDVGITTFTFTVSVSDKPNTKLYVIIVVIVVILLVVIIVTCVICKRRSRSEKRPMKQQDQAEAMQKLNTERTNEQHL